MANVLITGGSGLIGSYLSKRLLEKGYTVAFLSRKKKSENSIPTYTWDHRTNRIDKESINSADIILHLAGANIAEKRWTTKRRKQILESRVKSAELILKNIVEQKVKIKAFISASAIGYYGSVTSDKIYIENDTYYNDFVGNVCRSWEQAADEFQSIGIRTVKLRTGIVLTKKRGALEKMLTPSKFGIGAVLGNGKQYLPWIHIDDLCDIYIKAIEDLKMEGTYNAVAPEHISYKAFIKESAILFKNPIFKIYVPSFIIRIILGKMSEILLNGSRVSCNKLVKAGYNFKFPSIQSALTDLLVKNTNQ